MLRIGVRTPAEKRQRDGGWGRFFFAFRNCAIELTTGMEEILPSFARTRPCEEDFFWLPDPLKD